MDSAALSGGSMLRTFSHFLLGGLPFLMASRYCETDLLSNFAWPNFGSIKGGWAKVQAVCDYVNDRLTFS
jgi:transglutaminase-like putative cysteine protease